MSSAKAAKISGYKEAVESDLLDHPAVKVWLKINPGHAVPTRIENIRAWSSPKPFVCRLLGAGENGSAVIAKRCKASAGTIERLFYEEILPQLNLSKLHYYGCYPEGSGHVWIFLEDAGGHQLSFHKPADKQIAVQWLSDLHTSSSSLAKPENLIERNPAYYLDRLTTVQNTFNTHMHDGTFVATDRQAMANSLDQIERLGASWEKVHAIYHQLPRCVVHGDFKSKNIQLRLDQQPPSVFVFDWEYAGWGSPGIDMWRLDETEYKNAVRQHWPQCSTETIHHLKYLGTLFRAIDSYLWHVKSLEHAHYEHIRVKLIESLPEYDFYMADAKRALSIW